MCSTSTVLGSAARVGANNARWFDRCGLSHFTSGIFDGFYPGYGIGWPNDQGEERCQRDCGDQWARGFTAGFRLAEGDRYAFTTRCRALGRTSRALFRRLGALPDRTRI